MSVSPDALRDAIATTEDAQSSLLQIRSELARFHDVEREDAVPRHLEAEHRGGALLTAVGHVWFERARSRARDEVHTKRRFPRLFAGVIAASTLTLLFTMTTGSDDVEELSGAPWAELAQQQLARLETELAMVRGQITEEARDEARLPSTTHAPRCRTRSYTST